MKHLMYLFLTLMVGVLIMSCAKEQDSSKIQGEVQIENRDASVWICHKPEGNNPHAVYVNESAVAAHLGHGDALLDVDGDGFTAANACGEGFMDDCDDNDADINPGVEEVCGDGIDNNCDGQVDEDCVGPACWAAVYPDNFVITSNADFYNYNLNDGCGYRNIGDIDIFIRFDGGNGDNFIWVRGGGEIGYTCWSRGYNETSCCTYTISQQEAVAHSDEMKAIAANLGLTELPCGNSFDGDCINCPLSDDESGQ